MYVNVDRISILCLPSFSTNELNIRILCEGDRETGKKSSNSWTFIISLFSSSPSFNFGDNETFRCADCTAQYNFECYHSILEPIFDVNYKLPPTMSSLNSVLFQRGKKIEQLGRFRILSYSCVVLIRKLFLIIEYMSQCIKQNTQRTIFISQYFYDHAHMNRERKSNSFCVVWVRFALVNEFPVELLYFLSFTFISTHANY